MATKRVDDTGLSRGTVEVLLDLVEIKLGCIEVYDREDARELRSLERARAELMAMTGRPMASAAVVRLAGAGEETEVERIRGAA